MHYSVQYDTSGQDTTPPNVICPQNQQISASPGQTSVPVSYPPASATDNSGQTPRLSYSRPSGSAFPLGSTFVTVTATDNSGNSAQCTFTVTVSASGKIDLICSAPM